MSFQFLSRRPPIAAMALLMLLPACGVEILEALDIPNTDGGTCSGVKHPSAGCPDNPPNPGAACGNGVLEGAEQCDDGNTQNGDGCAGDCRLESGTPPGAVCGNGVLEGAEQCDDGNTQNGDGCAGDCRLESGPDACGCVDETISWGMRGGWATFEPLSTLSPCRAFSHEVVPVEDDGPTSTCAQEIESCEQGVSAGDVVAAIAHPDVVAAVAAAPVLYGHDPIPVDGARQRITLGNAVIDVGWDCHAASPDCVPIPEGVAALLDVLQQLEEEQLALGPCSKVFAR